MLLKLPEGARFNLDARRFLLQYNILVRFGVPAFLVACSLGLSPARLPAEEIKIGVILPFSGPAARYGNKPRKGIELALKDFLAKRHPRNSFKFLYEDDQCSAKLAVAAYQKLVNVDGVRIILGPSCSAASSAVAPIAERDGVFSAYYSEASSVPIGPNAVRLWIPNRLQAEMLAENVLRMGSRKVACLHIQNPYGNDFNDAFSRRFRELGGEIVYDQSYAPDTTDFNSFLINIRHKAPDAIILGSYVGDSAILIKQISNLRLNLRLFGTSLMDDPEFLNQAGGKVNFLYIAEVPDAVAVPFRKRWSDVYHEEWPGLASGGSIFYDFLTMLLPELDKSRSVSAVELKQHLIALPAWEGVTGTFDFDSTGNLLLKHAILRLENGRFIVDQ